MPFFKSISLIACCLLLLSSQLHAQTENPNRELLLRTDELQPYKVYRISQQLEAIHGVHFWGYIPETQTLLITYDETKIEDPTIIIETIEHFNQETCIEVHEGTSIFAMIDGLKTEE
jgi:hypothetical protein